MCRDKVDEDVSRIVECIIELVVIRDNMLQLSSDVFLACWTSGTLFPFHVLVSLCIFCILYLHCNCICVCVCVCVF